MTKRLTVLLALAASAAFTAPAAAATIYTSRAAFLAATTSAVVSNFEENGDAAFTFYPAGYAGSGFLITSSNNLFTVDPQYDPLYEFGSGDVLDFESGQGTIAVDAGVTAFGFDLGDPSDIDSDTGFITINGVDYAVADQPALSFFGIVADAGDAPFGATLVNFNGGLGIVDNFTIANAGIVPEPATWAMMIGGMGLAAGSLRARRRKVAFAVA